MALTSDQGTLLFVLRQRVLLAVRQEFFRFAFLFYLKKKSFTKTLFFAESTSQKFLI